MKQIQVKFRSWVDRKLNRPDRVGTIIELHGHFQAENGLVPFYWIAPDDDPAHLVEVNGDYIMPIKTVAELVHEINDACCTVKVASSSLDEKLEYIKNLPAWAELISEVYHHPLKEHLKTLENVNLNKSAAKFYNELRKIVKERE